MVARSAAAVRTTGGRVILGLSRRARKRRVREERVSAGMRVASRGLSEGRRRGGRRRHSLLPCELVPLYGILSCLVCSLIVVVGVLFCPPDLIAKARKKGKERERGALPLFRGNEISIWTFPEFFRVFSPLKPSYPRTETCRGHLTGSDTDREDSERGRPEPCPNRIRSTGVDRSTVDGRESSPLDREHTRWVGRSVTSRVEVASRSGPVAYGLCLLKGGRDQAAGLLHSL